MIKINLVLKFEKYGKNLRHNLYVYFSKYAKPQKVLVLSNKCFVEVLLKFIFPILMFFFFITSRRPIDFPKYCYKTGGFHSSHSLSGGTN